MSSAACDALMEIIDELPLTEADRAAGVTGQAMVKPGVKWQGEPIRFHMMGLCPAR